MYACEKNLKKAKEQREASHDARARAKNDHMAPAKRKPTAAAAASKKKKKENVVDEYDFDAQVAQATINTTTNATKATTTTSLGRKTPKKAKTKTTSSVPPPPLSAAAAALVPSQRLALEFIKGPLKGVHFLNPKNLSSLKIGRVKPGNQIHVKDDAVSQKHAHIFWNRETNRWEIVDLGSSNGTYVDDVELDEHSEARALKDGSTIKIGNQTTMAARIRPSQEKEEVDEREGETAKKKEKKQNGKSKKSVGVVEIEAKKTKKVPLSTSAKGNNKSVALAGGGTKRTKRMSSIRPEAPPSQENDDNNDDEDENYNNKNCLAEVPAKMSNQTKSPLRSVGPKKRVAPPVVLEKKAKKTKPTEEKEDASRRRENNDKVDKEGEKSNETTLERLQRWSSELVGDVRASAERAIEKLFREKKKIEAELREEFAAV
jgi:pSer/pThr/pTyr-binding forkhead associated (FHA) protein